MSPTRRQQIGGMKVRILPMISALTLLATCLCACAETFEDLWLTRIKSPPYGGLVKEIDGTIAANGKRLHPYRDPGPCAHARTDWPATPRGRSNTACIQRHWLRWRVQRKSGAGSTMKMSRAAETLATDADSRARNEKAADRDVRG